jgi:hypothetical protein
MFSDCELGMLMKEAIRIFLVTIPAFTSRNLIKPRRKSEYPSSGGGMDLRLIKSETEAIDNGTVTFGGVGIAQSV